MKEIFNIEKLLFIHRFQALGFTPLSMIPLQKCKQNIGEENGAAIAYEWKPFLFRNLNIFNNVT